MIAFLDGTLAAKGSGMAFVNVGGVGFAVDMSATDLSRLPEKGSHVTVFTYMAVREDAISLYGFLSQESKDLFERLIGVSGIGPKVALAAIGTFRPQELAAAIAAQDVKAISSIPGVGKKMAQRMILELKGTMEQDEAETLFGDGGAAAAARLRGAHEALLAMGFSSAEADVALKGAPDDLSTDSALLQYALKRLGA